MSEHDDETAPELHYGDHSGANISRSEMSTMDTGAELSATVPTRARHAARKSTRARGDASSTRTPAGVDSDVEKSSSATPRGKRGTRRTASTRKRAARAKNAQPPRPIGRPPKIPDAKMIRQVEKLAFLNMTIEEIADIIELDPKTFAKYREAYFRPVLKKGLAKNKMVTSSALMREVGKGNMTAIIWNEKTRHGYSERLITLPPGDGSPTGLPAGSLMGVAIGLFLPVNGREVAAQGHEIPADFRIMDTPPSTPPAASSGIQLPTNGREIE